MKADISSYIKRSSELVKAGSMKEVRIAFLSNFTLIGMAETIKVLCSEQNIWAECYLSPYNQYAQDILDKSSSLHSFNPNIIFILLDLEDLLGDFYYFPYRMKPQQRKNFIREKFSQIKNLISILENSIDAKIIVNNFQIPSYSSRGILETKQKFGIKECIWQFNNMLGLLSLNDSKLFAFDFNSFAARLGHENVFDRRTHYFGNINLSSDAAVRLSQEYMGYILPLVPVVKKCIVLDLDNTLWGGIVGEIGIEHIKLGPDREGKPFLDFQKRLLELFERGIILAVNSKNNWDDAIKVLHEHPYMVLKEKHFSSIKINWADKAANIREIASDLNIGMDSMVFIDDDPHNRLFIKSIFPEILVVDLPDDPSLYADALMSLNVFNAFQLTDEDMARGKMYVEDRQRKDLRIQFSDLTDFLKSLGMKVKIEQSSKFNISRISQLTYRTNQFNLTSRRYSEEDIGKFSKDPGCYVCSIQVEDKLGDNGIVGCSIIKKDRDDIFIDSFLMSCRVLGRGIEKVLLSHIIDQAKRIGAKRVIGEYVPTKKNSQTDDFYKKFGFSLLCEKDGSCFWFIDLKDYSVDYPDFIQVTSS